MRKISLIVALILTASMAVGQQSVSDLPDPGTAPGDILYGLEKAQESVSLALTFDREAKAEKRLKFAEERLAESRHLMESGDNQSAERAAERYSELVQRVNDTAQQTENEELQQKLQVQLENRQDILRGIQDRLPAEADTRLENAIDQGPENGSRGPEQLNRSTGPQRSTGGFVVTGGSMPENR